MTIVKLPVRERIFVALDGMGILKAKHTVDVMIDLGITRFKVGKKLIDLGVGGEIAEYIEARMGLCFWDNKNVDILNTLVAGVESSIDLGVGYANLMASAGPRKLKAVQEAAGDDILLMAVTVLTDLDDEECTAIYGAPVAPTVRRFAGFAEEAGLWGLVCSADDLANLREFGIAQSLVKVTPAIRPRWAAPNDQARIVTPADAWELGADMLVIGRPIIDPPLEFEGKKIGTPERAIELIIEESEAVLVKWTT